MLIASQLPWARVTVRSCSIIGNRGVKAKRPTPIADAMAIMPAMATSHGRWLKAEGVDEGGEDTAEDEAEGAGAERDMALSIFF